MDAGSGEGFLYYYLQKLGLQLSYCLSVPHEPFFRTANFLRGKHLWQWGNDPEHLHNYSGAAFRRLVSQWVDIQWHGYAFPWQLIWATKRDSSLAPRGDSS